MSFTSQWKRYGCCPLDSCNLPQPPNNLVIFYVYGYNYRVIPQWANSEGRTLIPLQFAVNGDRLLYKWTFYKPYNVPLYDMMWYFSTSDDIVPSISEWLTGTQMKVRRLYKYNGYTLWEVSC